MIFFNKIDCGLLIALLFWQGNVYAQEVKMYNDKTPTAEEMGSILFSKQPSESKLGGVKMRSISFGTPKGSLHTHSDKQVPTIGLPIKFAYNSSEVLEESKPSLNEIGRMLSLPAFSNEKLHIEGHTDAAGPEEYNRLLSKRRAQSVKKYLKNNFNITSRRLLVTGVGESQALPGVDPYAADNRRVQFRKAP